MNIAIGRKLAVAIALAMALAGGAPDGSAKAPDKNINKAVVKIFSVSNAPNFYIPWQFKPQMSGIGSGVILSGHRVLTNAHMVANSVFIQVKKSGDPTKYQARVAAVGHQCDLALLTVDDPTFFQGTESLELGGLPDPQDEVSVFGFPKGATRYPSPRGSSAG